MVILLSIEPLQALPLAPVREDGDGHDTNVHTLTAANKCSYAGKKLMVFIVVFRKRAC